MTKNPIPTKEAWGNAMQATARLLKRKANRAKTEEIIKEVQNVLEATERLTADVFEGDSKLDLFSTATLLRLAKASLLRCEQDLLDEETEDRELLRWTAKTYPAMPPVEPLP